MAAPTLFIPPSYQGKKIAVAVSGGSDSMALVYKLYAAYQAGDIAQLSLFHVHHGLRVEADDDAHFVQETAAELGLTFACTRLDGAALKNGNMQQNARQARYFALSKLAQAHAVDVVAVGHTANDAVETFFMRLSKGSGLRGLAPMATVFKRDGTCFWRPLLEVSREDLRDYLQSLDKAWREDPSNDNPAFQRVRVRQKMPEFAALGLTPDTVLASMQALARADTALDKAAQSLFAAVFQKSEEGYVLGHALQEADEELQLRVLEKFFKKMHGAERVAPRTSKRLGLLEKWRSGTLPTTLGGYLFQAHKNGMRISEQRAPQNLPENKAKAMMSKA